MIIRILILSIVVCGGSCAKAASGDLPDSGLTPGDLMVDKNGKPTGRPKGSTKEIRSVSGKTSEQAFDEYDIPSTHRNGDDYEIDHLISLVLGGSNDIKNLWPQTRKKTDEWNAWEKDKLENKLYHLVDAGIVPIATAQHDIKTNWIAAYEKYMPMNIHGKNDYVAVTTTRPKSLSYRSLYASKFLNSDARYVHYVLKSGRQPDDPDDD